MGYIASIEVAVTMNIGASTALGVSKASGVIVGRAREGDRGMGGPPFQDEPLLEHARQTGAHIATPSNP